ncbi:MAG: hypothetical protein CVT65_03810 [Actinobacteria bacterium HGW-Actinobacteria-5]|nr:MAG: hypothetical protein CVT65_03810 [Actinobacteria bacterium HGW-Actinobacteria-5]
MLDRAGRHLCVQIGRGLRELIPIHDGQSHPGVLEVVDQEVLHPHQHRAGTLALNAGHIRHELGALRAATPIR